MIVKLGALPCIPAKGCLFSARSGATLECDASWHGRCCQRKASARTRNERRGEPLHQRRIMMPEQRTIEAAREDKREGKAPSTQAGEFVREEMHHIREGKHGARSTKQAIAIGLSKARRAGVELPAPGRGQAQAKTRTAAKRALAAGRRRKKVVSSTRSRATKSALKREGRSAASRTALARQATSAARRRGKAARSAAAKKAVRTKGPRVRSAAARKAARTRARRR